MSHKVGRRSLITLSIVTALVAVTMSVFCFDRTYDTISRLRVHREGGSNPTLVGYYLDSRTACISFGGLGLALAAINIWQVVFTARTFGRASPTPRYKRIDHGEAMSVDAAGSAGKNTGTLKRFFRRFVKICYILDRGSQDKFRRFMSTISIYVIAICVLAVIVLTRSAWKLFNVMEVAGDAAVRSELLDAYDWVFGTAVLCSFWLLIIGFLETVKLVITLKMASFSSADAGC